MSPMPASTAFNDNDKGRLTSSQAISLLPVILMCVALLITSAGFASVPIRKFMLNGADIKFVFDLVFYGLISFALLVIGLLSGLPRVIDLVRGKVLHIDGMGLRNEMTGFGKGGNGVFYLIGETNFKKGFENSPTVH